MKKRKTPAGHHVMLDALLYSDIQPFFPFTVNPMYGMISASTLYWICVVAFLPAVGIYVVKIGLGETRG